MTIIKENIKTSATDSLWSVAIYFFFRKYYGDDLLLNAGDIAVIFSIVVFIFIAGCTVENS